MPAGALQCGPTAVAVGVHAENAHGRHALQETTVGTANEAVSGMGIDLRAAREHAADRLTLFRLGSLFCYGNSPQHSMAACLKA